MAIGYSGPRGMSMLLKVNAGIAGTKDDKNIYLSTTIASLQPMLAAPFILNVIKNTNRTAGPNAEKNSRYYYQQKSGKATVISNSENPVVNDPRKIAAENIEVTVKQVAPESVGKKFSGARKDLALEGLENVASAKIASYIVERRIEKQTTAWQLLVKAAEDIQTTISTADSGATTWAKGAHRVQESFTTGEELYKSLRTAIAKFKKLGLPNAPGEFNKNIPCVMGIQPNDMLIILTTDSSSLLLEMPGVLASDKGNELFQQLNLNRILNVPTLIDDTLPEGVNYMILTTGTHGSLAYEECGTIANQNRNGMNIATLEQVAEMVPDPEWTGYYRIDYEETFKMDVIFPELIYVSSEAEVIGKKSMKADLKDGSVSEATVQSLITKSQEELNNLQESKNGILKEIQKLKAAPTQDKEAIKAAGVKLGNVTAKIEVCQAKIKSLQEALASAR